MIKTPDSDMPERTWLRLATTVNHDGSRNMRKWDIEKFAEGVEYIRARPGFAYVPENFVTAAITLRKELDSVNESLNCMFDEYAEALTEFDKQAAMIEASKADGQG